MHTVTAFITASYPYLGMSGAVLICAAVLCAMLPYRGREGERYSLLNHFISELGEVGVSRLAWLFNAALVMCGLLLIPFAVGLGLRLGGVWGWLGGLAGLWTAVAVSLVGVFPMNRIKPHTVVAVAYFRGGLVMVLLFGIGVLAHPGAIPWQAALFSLLAFACYATFLFSFPRRKKEEEAPGALDVPEEWVRPHFWHLAALEWLVFLATMIWIFGVAVLVIWR